MAIEGMRMRFPAIVIVWVAFASAMPAPTIKRTKNEQSWTWATASPESVGIAGEKLEALWRDLKVRNTHDFLVIRNDRIIFERYAPGHSRTTPHYTASMAKA